MVVGYGHMYDIGTRTCTVQYLHTHELLSLVGTGMDLSMSGVVTYQYNCDRAIIDT